MQSPPKIIVFKSSEQLFEFLLNQWKITSAESIRKRGKFMVAFCGGKSPIDFFRNLSLLNSFKSWDKTHIFLTDERFVSIEDQESNYRLLKEKLLDFIDIPTENIHPVNTKLTNIQSSAEDYKKILAEVFELKAKEVPVFDFIFLGIGDDGHVASLFMNDQQEVKDENMVLPVALEQLKLQRISLSFSVINNARNVFCVAQGNNKALIIKQFIEEKKKLSVSKIKMISGIKFVLIDQPAASQLKDSQKYLFNNRSQ